MTKKQFLRLQKALVFDVPELLIDGGLLRLPSEDCLLTAISFDSSGYTRQAFYIQTLVMPLFVPHEYLDLSYGDRLQIDGKIDAWRSDDPDLLSRLKSAIISQALPFLRSINSLRTFVKYLRTRPKNIRSLEALGCALAKDGSIAEAIETLAKISSHIHSFYQWEIDLLLRTTMLHDQLLSDPVGAQEHLTSVVNLTRHSLKLSALPGRPS